MKRETRRPSVRGSRRSTREVRAAVERIEAVGCANVGDEERELLVRPNDLRRVVDHIDATDAEVKRLRKENEKQREVMRRVRVLVRERKPITAEIELDDALKPRKAKRHG